MAIVTVGNLTDEVHRALRVRAAEHGRSIEAEVRAILEATVLPPERIKLGSLLASIAREAGALTDAEVQQLDQLRDSTPAEPIELGRSSSKPTRCPSRGGYGNDGARFA